MDDLINKFKKSTHTIKQTLATDEDNVSEGTISEKQSRAGSFSSTNEELTNEQLETRKKRKAEEELKVSKDLTMELVKRERSVLEEFLLNENSKINKSSAKFILSRWMKLEEKLHETIMEREREKMRVYFWDNQGSSGGTYAQIAATSIAPARQPVTETKRKTVSIHETVLIKPEKEEDKRSNDDIKSSVIKQLSNVKDKIKIKRIRQMRSKGIVIKVQSEKDVELVKTSNLSKVGLKVEKPKRFLPSVIIYGVEKELTSEEIKQDLMNKNFDYLSITEREKLKEKVNIKYSFATKENKVNWIAQMPGSYLNRLLKQEKVFIRWRTYPIKEYINIRRCFKCQGYGHIAKYCNAPSQICEDCGQEGHDKKECNSKEVVKCINCIKTRRKDSNHTARNKQCPEYLRQKELYFSRIDWT